MLKVFKLKKISKTSMSVLVLALALIFGMPGVQAEQQNTAATQTDPCQGLGPADKAQCLKILKNITSSKQNLLNTYAPTTNVDNALTQAATENNNTPLPFKMTPPRAPQLPGQSRGVVLPNQGPNPPTPLLPNFPIEQNPPPPAPATAGTTNDSSKLQGAQGKNTDKSGEQAPTTASTTPSEQQNVVPLTSSDATNVASGTDAQGVTQNQAGQNADSSNPFRERKTQQNYGQSIYH
jgi:hypothetical protein